MRNPNRIVPIMCLIETIWKRNPDLRLCQLIGNATFDKRDNYSIEDDELEKRLKELYCADKKEVI